MRIIWAFKLKVQVAFKINGLGLASASSIHWFKWDGVYVWWVVLCECCGDSSAGVLLVGCGWSEGVQQSCMSHFHRASDIAAGAMPVPLGLVALVEWDLSGWAGQNSLEECWGGN